MRKLRLWTIGLTTMRGFAAPAFNFLIVVLGVKLFGTTDWAELINVMIWVFLIAFVSSWGNYDYLLRSFSQTPNTMYHKFYSNFFSRMLLLPLSLLLFIFFPLSIATLAVVLVFLNFCYTSLNPLVVYHQKFGAQLISESLGFFIIGVGLFYLKYFELQNLLIIYVLSTLTKLLCLIFQLKLPLFQHKITLSLSHYKVGFPFFILGFSSWMVSKIDIYFVDFYLEKPQLSEYKLLITSFLMLQALSAYIVMPFTKHIYRISESVMIKIKQKLYAVALPILLLGTLSIYIVMRYFVNLNFGYQYYLLGLLIALPSFFYTLNIMHLIRTHQEKHVILMSFLGVLINTVLVLLLIKNYKILGVLISVCCGQWCILLALKIDAKFRQRNIST